MNELMITDIKHDSNSGSWRSLVTQWLTCCWANSPLCCDDEESLIWICLVRSKYQCWAFYHKIFPKPLLEWAYSWEMWDVRYMRQSIFIMHGEASIRRVVGLVLRDSGIQLALHGWAAYVLLLAIVNGWGARLVAASAGLVYESGWVSDAIPDWLINGHVVLSQGLLN